MPPLTVGDPAPWFIPASIAKHEACQDIVVGGYRVVLFFFGSTRDARIQQVLQEFLLAQTQFQQAGVTVLGVSIDGNDRVFQPKVEPFNHFRFLWDLEGELSVQYGVCQLGVDKSGISYDPTTFILDENLRILDIIPLEIHVPHLDRILNSIQRLPASAPPQLITRQAPVVLIPNVFPAEFCQYLIDLYETDGGTESGFMKQDGDKAVVTLDYGIKRRKDLMITESALLSKINYFVGRRIIPEVFKAFQFHITQFERYLVGCYEDSTQGFFKPHRDNVNAGAAHRRFAMTLNLNTGYEGGCLRFPEYGGDLYRPAAGDAVVFSCSLLHEVTPVTQGRRFALLSFFYNDEDAKLREQTRKQIVRQDGANVLFDAGNQAIEAKPVEAKPVEAKPATKKAGKPDRSLAKSSKRRKDSPAGF